MSNREIAEHDRFYPVRNPKETAQEFLRRCIAEHRLSHETWIESLRNNPGLATEATVGLAYQQRAVHRYDEMLVALDELCGRDVKPPRAIEEVEPTAIAMCEPICKCGHAKKTHAPNRILASATSCWVSSCTCNVFEESQGQQEPSVPKFKSVLVADFKYCPFCGDYAAECCGECEGAKLYGRESHNES